jgi:hypothetical protein
MATAFAMRAILLFAAAWLTCFVPSLDAAEFRIGEGSAYGIVLEGEIVRGDYEKLRSLIEDTCLSKWSRECLYQLSVASPGGSVAEAMKIGRLVRTLGFDVVVPDDTDAMTQAHLRMLKLEDPKRNNLCASACFFIAVAGIARLPDLGYEKPRLGIHRPFLTDEELKTISASQVLSSAGQVRAVVETYLREMSVPTKYVDLMFSTPKDQVRWITSDEYHADIAGTVPELDQWLKARCQTPPTELEKRLRKQLATKARRGEQPTAGEVAGRTALDKKLEAEVKCESALIDKMREDAYNAYISRRPGLEKDLNHLAR